MAEKFIPVCEPLLAGDELKYVEDAVRTGWISSAGSYVERLEKEFAAYVGVKHAVAAVNGTAALHLACVAAGLGPGDEVILPTFTMIASAFAVCYTGAKPVFVDCDPHTWTMDVAAIEAKIGPRTRAIMPVHIYGHTCDMRPINELARTHGLVVIEDAAEAIGSEDGGRKCGALGDIGCFSLFANKVITTGEGGLVTTDDDALAERCRYYKNLCFPMKGARVYEHAHIGFNYRMSNVLAAIGVAQLERADYYVGLRRRHARLYQGHLAGAPGITVQPEKAGTINSYWMFSILIEDEFGLSRDDVMAALRQQGVDTRRFFVPMHQQRSLLEFCGGIEGAYPVSEHISARGLYLPSGSGLSDDDVASVSRAVLALGRVSP